jgi:nucleoside-diphosphate-sugar epimerase
MKALVTGCAGFIGSHVVERLLKEGYGVKGIDSFTDYYSRAIKEENIARAIKNKSFSFIEEDITQMTRFPDADYVFHLAAQAGVRASWGKDFEIYMRDNVLATQKLLEFYKQNRIKKFVFASSSSVYGNAELPMREDSVLKPVSPYGVTKLAAENLCYLYCKTYNVPTVSLRYFTVYGPRQRPDMAINKFVNAVLNDEEIIVFGDGKQTRDFTFIDDVVEATIAVAKNHGLGIGETFNVGGGNRVSVHELINQIANTVGKKARITYTERQKGDVKDTHADITKITKLLHWASKITLEEGLRRYVEWYQKIE